MKRAGEVLAEIRFFKEGMRGPNFMELPFSLFAPQSFSQQRDSQGIHADAFGCGLLCVPDRAEAFPTTRHCSYERDARGLAYVVAH